MSHRFRITNQAKKDLDAIWEYLTERSFERADTILDEIQNRFPLLAQFPKIGRTREELSPNLRSFPVGEFLIFYRPMEQGVEIVRVLGGRRNIEPIFQGREDKDIEEM